jgi:cytoskeletal protein RodZ
VYARGFVRNYASYLGLPPEELIAVYRHERGISEQIRIVPATSSPRLRSYVLPNFFGVFFITIALLGLSYIALSALGRVGNGNEVAIVPSPTVPPPTPLPTVPTTSPDTLPTPLPVLPTAIPTPAAGFAPQTAIPTATPQAPIVVVVSVKSTSASGSWLRVQQDGVIAFEGVMKGGESQSFTAQRRIFIRSGNPAAVLVSVNGLAEQPLGGAAGKALNWEWPPP